MGERFDQTGRSTLAQATTPMLHFTASTSNTKASYDPRAEEHSRGLPEEPAFTRRPPPWAGVCLANDDHVPGALPEMDMSDMVKDRDTFGD